MKYATRVNEKIPEAQSSKKDKETPRGNDEKAVCHTLNTIAIKLAGAARLAPPARDTLVKS